MSKSSRVPSAGESGDYRVGPWEEQQLERYAVSIANGKFAFPEDLPKPDQTKLEQAVRHQLCDRLLRYFAWVIAQEGNETHTCRLKD